MRLRFTKMQGAGNDFVVLDATRARTKRTKQRAPLPHCSTSSPLVPLKMR